MPFTSILIGLITLVQLTLGYMQSIQAQSSEIFVPNPTDLNYQSLDGLSSQNIEEIPAPSTSTDPSYLIPSSDTILANCDNLYLQLLNTADSALQLYNFRDAARLYAELTVRYGPSDLLFGRRFVAQVMCGDFEQAEIVLESAQLAGFQIHEFELPNGSIATLISDLDLVSERSEALAAHAISKGNPDLSLKVVGTWLELCGDAQRGAIFIGPPQP
ncbi:MAG: hypothetical protein KDB03_13345 [Planctomycetales bacterium]|nr:hypothetical protein [Planctomycetales bacterium]